MDSMVRRVTKAMMLASGYSDAEAQDLFSSGSLVIRREAIEAGIEAMREPTEAMVLAGEAEIFEYRAEPADWSLESIKRGWQTMIDEALKP